MLKYFVSAQSFAMSKWDDLQNREDGQTMAEYGVVLAVITLGIIAALTLLAGGVREAILDVVGRLNPDGSSTP